MNIGENIKRIREQLGMSQEELADKMGYKSRSAITKVEKGQRDINQKKIKQYAKVLGVTETTLMGIEVHDDTDNQAINKPNDIDVINTDEIKIIARHLEQVPDADRERVMKAIANTIDIFIDNNKG